jgi:multiple sugar transport system permease protein
MDNENTAVVQRAPSVPAGMKSKKELKKEEKERMKKFHVSTWHILTNYRSYKPEEKKHYRYILGRRASGVVWPIFRFLILFGLAFVVIYPILYMISCALRPQMEMSDPSIMWIPKTLTFANLEETWIAIDYPKLVWDTVTVNVVCSIIQVLTCSIAGYGFARFKFKGKSIFFAIVILQIIVPTQVILIPQFMQFRYFDPFHICTLLTGGPVNLADSPWALYLQAFFCNGIRAGLFIFLFRQFFRGLPKELEDAAYLDGCGPFKAYLVVMVLHQILQKHHLYNQ